jgi:hypothetical protein
MYILDAMAEVMITTEKTIKDTWRRVRMMRVRANSSEKMGNTRRSQLVETTKRKATAKFSQTTKKRKLQDIQLHAGRQRPD